MLEQQLIYFRPRKSRPVSSCVSLRRSSRGSTSIRPACAMIGRRLPRILAWDLSLAPTFGGSPRSSSPPKVTGNCDTRPPKVTRESTLTTYRNSSKVSPSRPQNYVKYALQRAQIRRSSAQLQGAVEKDSCSDFGNTLIAHTYNYDEEINVRLHNTALLGLHRI
jgi:hypothetical protein